VSGFVKQHLPILLVQHLTSGAGLNEALTAGFLEVDAGLASSNVDCEFSGSTCSLAYLKVGMLAGCAWLGGCGACRGSVLAGAEIAFDITCWLRRELSCPTPWQGGACWPAAVLQGLAAPEGCS
jgi:hypothetical protein